MVSTCEVLWSARLNTSKVTRNRQEDRSSQKRSVGLSTARVVGAHRDQYQRRWTATVRHLICVNVRRMELDGRDWIGDRHRDTSLTVRDVWRLKSRKSWELSYTHLFACKVTGNRLDWQSIDCKIKFIVRLYDWCYITENIEKVSDSFVCLL